jgi:hypothetical protein
VWTSTCAAQPTAMRSVHGKVGQLVRPRLTTAPNSLPMRLRQYLCFQPIWLPPNKHLALAMLFSYRISPAVSMLLQSQLHQAAAAVPGLSLVHSPVHFLHAFQLTPFSPPGAASAERRAACSQLRRWRPCLTRHRVVQAQPQGSCLLQRLIASRRWGSLRRAACSSAPAMGS